MVAALPGNLIKHGKTWNFTVKAKKPGKTYNFEQKLLKNLDMLNSKISIWHKKSIL